MSEKAEQLRRLALKRRSAEWPGYRHLREFHGGAYECEYVSPYTKSADNVDAAIFILLQDWISEDRLAGPLIPEAIELGQIPSRPTTNNLS